MGEGERERESHNSWTSYLKLLHSIEFLNICALHSYSIFCCICVFTVHFRCLPFVASTRILIMIMPLHVCWKFNVLLMFSCVCAKIISKNNITIERRKKKYDEGCQSIQLRSSCIVFVASGPDCTRTHAHNVFYIIQLMCTCGVQRCNEIY